MKNITIYTLMIISLLIGCTKSEKRSNQCEEIIISNGSFEDRGLVIDQLSYQDGDLSMTVGYSGCTADHDLDLIWDGMILESNPPQVNLVVVDNEEIEACLAFFNQEECFDLTPLLDHLSGEDRLILNLSQSTSTSLFIDL